MGFAKKKRLDLILVEKNYCMSRENAKRLIMAGKVFVEGKRVDKPGTKFKDNISFEIKVKDTDKYVSRGGLKLEEAIKVFKLDVNERICLDVGASTGGFTHCLLLNGAKHIYSLDVGYGQIAWDLRNDERVSVIERTNIRYVTRDLFPVEPDFACVDVSFISLDLVLPKLDELIVSPKTLILLIKPQFELIREKIGKKGVVKDPKLHKEAIKKVIDTAEKKKLNLKGLTYSPIKGPKGNIEYLIYFEETYSRTTIDEIQVIEDVVKEAHNKLSC